MCVCVLKPVYSEIYIFILSYILYKIKDLDEDTVVVGISTWISRIIFVWTDPETCLLDRMFLLEIILVSVSKEYYWLE